MLSVRPHRFAALMNAALACTAAAADPGIHAATATLEHSLSQLTSVAAGTSDVFCLHDWMPYLDDPVQPVCFILGI
jgi:hypothetical protein